MSDTIEPAETGALFREAAALDPAAFAAIHTTAHVHTSARRIAAIDQARRNRADDPHDEWSASWVISESILGHLREPLAQNPPTAATASAKPLRHQRGDGA